jgi:tetratricopeptide (TPR) repeat protein
MESLRSVNRVLEYNQKNLEAFAMRGDIYMNLIDYPEAAEDYRTVLRLDKENEYLDVINKLKHAMELSIHMEKRDYYEVLEVGKNAFKDEINKAWKKKSIKWHPDKHPKNIGD